MCKGTGLFALLLLMVAISATGWSQEVSYKPNEVLTLDQAIDLALHQNYSVRDAELEAGKTGNELAATRTYRLPTIQLFSVVSEQFIKPDVSAGGVNNNVFPGVGSFFALAVPRRPTAVVAGLILQPLSQQYRIGLTIKQSKLVRETAKERLRLTRQSTIDSVKASYYGILEKQSALDSIQESITSYRELDRYTSEQVAQRVSLKSTNLDIKTRLARAEYEAVDLSNDLAKRKEQLNKLLGCDVRTEFRLEPPPIADGLPVDLEGARKRALEQRPEIREARLRMEQAQVERRLKKAEYIPDVSAGFSYMTFRNFDQTIPKNLANAGIGIAWEVFDWGRKREQLAAKDKAILQARERLNDAESSVLVDVSDKFRQLRQTRQAFVVAQLAEETARETLRVNTNKYKLTAALLSDVLQSQSSLAEANHEFQKALLGYWTAKAEFERALGEAQ